MLKDLNSTELSELEREFELEMDDQERSESDELEAEFEGLEGYEADEPAGEYEGPDGEYEEGDREGSGYADRFFELSQRGYETEEEVDEELNGLLNEMGQEYFFGSLKRALKKNLPGIKGLLNKAKSLALQHPALRGLKGLTGLTGLAQKMLKNGSLKGLAQAALSLHPAGAAALPALKALGFEAKEDSEANRDAWNNYVEVAREAYEYLAENLNERIDNPLEASRHAATAFQTALKRVQSRVPARRGRQVVYDRRGRPGQRRRVIRLKRGERILIIGE